METGRQTQQTEPVVSSRREADGRRLLGLTVQAAQEEIPEQVLRIRENARIAQAKLDDLTHLPEPGTREDDMSPGLAWPAYAGRDRDAVLQPPQPEVIPSAQVLDHHHAAQGASADAEAERG